MDLLTEKINLAPCAEGLNIWALWTVRGSEFHGLSPCTENALLSLEFKCRDSEQKCLSLLQPSWWCTAYALAVLKLCFLWKVNLSIQVLMLAPFAVADGAFRGNNLWSENNGKCHFSHEWLIWCSLCSYRISVLDWRVVGRHPSVDAGEAEEACNVLQVHLYRNRN